jgi:hypothetical protein
MASRGDEATSGMMPTSLGRSTAVANAATTAPNSKSERNAHATSSTAAAAHAVGAPLPPSTSPTHVSGAETAARLARRQGLITCSQSSTCSSLISAVLILPTSELPLKPQVEQLNVNTVYAPRRRRHRKRLAQIVVGQWKWFASDALAMLPGSMHHGCGRLSRGLSD